MCLTSCSVRGNVSEITKEPELMVSVRKVRLCIFLTEASLK
jgi:hypothetical protein